MNAWTVAGRRASTSPCVRASVAASPVNPAEKKCPRMPQRVLRVLRSTLCFLTGSEGQLGKRPAFAFHHLEPENPRHGRRDIHGPDRAFGAGAFWHAGSKG